MQPPLQSKRHKIAITSKSSLVPLHNQHLLPIPILSDHCSDICPYISTFSRMSNKRIPTVLQFYVCGTFLLRVKLLQSCPTVCDPMDSSPPGFSHHGILQARILEWVPMSSCRGSTQPRDQSPVSCVSCTGRWVLYHQHHLGSPLSGTFLLAQCF